VGKGEIEGKRGRLPSRSPKKEFLFPRWGREKRDRALWPLYRCQIFEDLVDLPYSKLHSLDFNVRGPRHPNFLQSFASDLIYVK
jgi:hypothetical protein